jgi:hypothetical protein
MMIKMEKLILLNLKKFLLKIDIINYIFKEYYSFYKYIMLQNMILDLLMKYERK